VDFGIHVACVWVGCPWIILGHPKDQWIGWDYGIDITLYCDGLDNPRTFRGGLWDRWCLGWMSVDNPRTFRGGLWDRWCLGWMSVDNPRTFRGRLWDRWCLGWMSMDNPRTSELDWTMGVLASNLVGAMYNELLMDMGLS
jgi:hypothetical protein